jgi:hypothetical protein
MLDMGAIKVLINEKWLRRLKSMAKEYGIGMSDLFNEMAEWVLDQEDDFRKDLEEELPEEEESEEEESEEEGSEEEGSEASE